jgi:hypothetical protein
MRGVESKMATPRTKWKTQRRRRQKKKETKWKMMTMRMMQTVAIQDAIPACPSPVLVYSIAERVARIQGTHYRHK